MSVTLNDPDWCDNIAEAELPPARSPGEQSPIVCSVRRASDPPAEGPGVTDPVRFSTGEFHLAEHDMRVKGRGFDFVWSRRYRSQAEVTTTLGHNWQHAYDVSLSNDPLGSAIILDNGWGRREGYESVGPDRWGRVDHFTDLTRLANGTFELAHPDKSVWRFRPLDGSASEGRISAIEDRNGNEMVFAYDTAGRLSTITDTLGRDYVLAYNSEGLLSSLTDFSGRRVEYAYYGPGDADGNPADLATVTGPAVTGTPTGNDFPDGKTVTYTYAKGTGVPELDHNLLTITDAKGQTFLSNVYSNEHNPSALGFDRVVRQRWGEVGDNVDIVYESQLATADNGWSVLSVLINDREGHVHELRYNASKRLVRERRYNGVADPDAPTTVAENRPGDPLRAEDPEFFETSWTYNDRGLLAEIVHPNGNTEEFDHDDSNQDPRRRGNLERHTERRGPMPGDSSSLVHRYEYLEDIGGCCGGGFVTRYLNPRNHDVLHEYDEFGNRTQTTHEISSVVENWTYNEFGQVIEHLHPDNGSGVRQRDVYGYFTSGPQAGYLASITRDADNFALLTAFEYDARGNRTAETDPRGNRTEFDYNQLDQLVAMRSAEVQTASGPVRYERRYIYDANDNPVREEIDNYDGDGVVDPDNPSWDRRRTFDILDRVTSTMEEVDVDQFITTTFSYDANGNRTHTAYGEANRAGGDPFNTLTVVYDARDLPLHEIRASGGPDQSTTRLNYDGNENLVRRVTGVEGTPRVTHFEFDGFDRRIAEVDPMGNRTTWSLDRNGNVLATEVFGELIDVVGDTGNVRMFDEDRTYDPMNRVTRIRRQRFTYDPVVNLSDEIYDFTYTDRSRPLTGEDPLGNISAFEYDSVGRLASVVDPVGNTIGYTYDDSSNRIAETSVEVSGLGRPPQSVTTTHAFDALDRLVATRDSAGNEAKKKFDSRNNLDSTIDPRGNRVEFVYDGLSRLVATERILTDSGTGQGLEIGRIVTSQEWDHSSRNVSRTDDNGNVTRYVYDARDNRTDVLYADGTLHTTGFDVHDNPTIVVDQNQTVRVESRDLNDRLVRRDVSAGPGVSSQTTFETFAHDGLSRMVRAEDDDSLVLRSYDSLSRLLGEDLNAFRTIHEYDRYGNKIETRFPGGREVQRDYDELNRLAAIEDVTGTRVSIASFDYVGPKRLERRTHGNGTWMDFRYNGIDGVPNPAGDDGSMQIVSIDFAGPNGLIESGFFRWDSAGNIVGVDRLIDGTIGSERVLGYDSVDRLVSSRETDGGGAVTRELAYLFDGVNNRLEVTGTDTVGGYARYSEDAAVNQYSRTPVDGGEVREYDDNGNLIRIGCPADLAPSFGVLDLADIDAFIIAFGVGDAPADLVPSFGVLDLSDVDVFISTVLAGCPRGSRELVYDFANRLVLYTDSLSGVTAEYTYDALGRRTSKVVQSPGAMLEMIEYAYDGQRMIEEVVNGGTARRSYVHGVFIDELVEFSDGTESYWYSHDHLYSVQTLSNQSGDVIERYAYMDYGEPSVVSGNGTPMTSSGVGNPWFRAGRYLDLETQLYNHRGRYLDPSAGRFVTADPEGVWYDGRAYGNRFAAMAASPWVFIDIHGLEAQRPDRSRDAHGSATRNDPIFLRDGFIEGSSADCVSEGGWIGPCDSDQRCDGQVEEDENIVVDNAEEVVTIASCFRNPGPVLLKPIECIMCWISGSCVNAVEEVTDFVNEESLTHPDLLEALD